MLSITGFQTGGPAQNIPIPLPGTEAGIIINNCAALNILKPMVLVCGV
jgi:hypothetical protein